MRERGRVTVLDCVRDAEREDRREIKKTGGERRSTAGILFDGQRAACSLGSVPSNKAGGVRRFTDTATYTAEPAGTFSALKKTMRLCLTLYPFHGNAIERVGE